MKEVVVFCYNVLSHHFAGGAEKSLKKFSQDSWSPDLGSN
jgi:hypothetical protein